ncbi:Ribosomal biogenesis protein LAS1L [Aphis craccivora]|uniref:Ribosomal biogenesis protein LAS1L n=1 Tax=Aphis craccivora TaxID=307492 RepID=A0A6G0YK46_APHCR|nr:Ribosomal biogenesis protein LAS1L [Aphis craccivora]
MEAKGEILVAMWSSDSEWQSLREDIFGHKNYKQALRKISLWKSRRKTLFRGLSITEMVLQAIIKDVSFNEDAEPTDDHDLIQAYSIALMKFINLTSDKMMPGPQRSIYYRASRLDIPKWVVDMRHTVSHAQDLPDLESLRSAVGYILEWIFIKYWNIDANFLIVEKKLNMNVVDEFIELLEFYMLSKSQISSDLKEKQLNVLREKLTLSDCYSNKECTKKIKDLLVNKSWSSDLVNVFTTRYLLQAHECNVSKGRISKTDKILWNVLLKILNNCGLMTNVLQCLVTQHSRIAALWVLELCIIAYKSSKKIDLKNNQNNNCMNFKPLNWDTNLVLRTALQSPHPHTIIFLKWLLQLNPLNVKQQLNIVKLVSLYTGKVKVSSKNIDQNIFTVDDLIRKDDHQSQWSRNIGQMNWRQIPFGTTL